MLVIRKPERTKKRSTPTQPTASSRSSASPIAFPLSRANPADIPKFVDEALRAFGVINTPRLVVRDCERFGVPFRAGDMVLCLLSVSGRDDRKNQDPASFDIDREQPAHLTFSTGPHLCIGHILARAEIRVLTEEWLKRVPAFTAVPDLRHGFRIGTVTAIQSLPLTWDLAPGSVTSPATVAANR